MVMERMFEIRRTWNGNLEPRIMQIEADSPGDWFPGRSTDLPRNLSCKQFASCGGG